jgi:hypothetical protein
LTAGGVGEQTIGGQFTFVEDGKTVPLKFEGNMWLFQDRTLTISADKMNVVYRGVVNQSLYHLQELLIKMLMHPLQV